MTTEAKILADKPGIYPGIPFGDYCDIVALNHSTLKHLVGVTPELGRYNMLHDIKDTKSLRKGHGTHSAVLTPDEFATEYVEMPVWGDGRVTANKEAKAKWIIENEHKIQLESTKRKDGTIDSEYQKCVAMRDRLLVHETANQFLTGPGQNEMTILWVDPLTGRMCKGRLDRLTRVDDWLTIVDIKSGKGLADWEISKAVEDYAYHMQFAGYVEGLNTIRTANLRVVLVWVCNEPPHEVRVTEMEEPVLAEGAAARAHYLKIYDECMKADHWPSYPVGVDQVDLPKYGYRFTQPEAR